MRKQRAFATLTEAEIEQIAEWLRTDTYEFVLDRIRQPRPHGYGLNISRKPLETLYAKKALLDLINTKVSEDKKLTLSKFDSVLGGTPQSEVRLAPGVDSGVSPESFSDSVSPKNEDKCKMLNNQCSMNGPGS